MVSGTDMEAFETPNGLVQLINCTSSAINTDKIGVAKTNKEKLNQQLSL